jgi:hypothetical protein
MRLAIFLAVVGAIALIAAGASWWWVARETDSEGSSDRPVLGVRRVRLAASSTAVAFWLLAASLLVALLVGL